MTFGPGRGGPGAKLRYQLSPEVPVTVTRGFTALSPKYRNGILSLWTRFPSDVQVTLQVQDSAGNNTLVPLEPNLEASRAGEWRYDSAQFRNRVAGLALIIRSPNKQAAQGELDFDEVTLRNAEANFQLSGGNETGMSYTQAEELAPVGVNIHLLRDDHSMDLARSAGFSFVRIDLLWSNVERRGRFRFFAYDLLLRSLEARKMGVLWILDYGHPDHGGQVPRTEEDLRAFSEFARAVAEHYRGRNVRYEIWNEPDNPQFWAGVPNPAEYAALLRNAVDAMRAADPAAIISSGGVSNLDLPYLRQVLDRGLAAKLNAISVHPYPKNGPETIVPAYVAVRNWAARELGQQIEIWESEWGYSSTRNGADSKLDGHREGDRERQANLAVRQILTVWGLNFPLSVWYDLRDDGTNAANPEQNYGLLDASGQEKPAMLAVRTLMTSARTRKFIGMLPDPPRGVHVMRLAGPHDRLLVVWTEEPKKDKTLECNREDLISAMSMTGKPLQLKSGSKGNLRLTISERAGPIYVLFKAGP
ncbi:MAG: cellulase family glycosylhydrolase [Bryobacteraceae bacterium]